MDHGIEPLYDTEIHRGKDSVIHMCCIKVDIVEIGSAEIGSSEVGIALQLHFFSRRSKKASSETQASNQLRETCLLNLHSLLQHGNRQLLGDSKTQCVGVVTNLSMCPPCPFLTRDS